jgi:hypothetical protein
MRTVTWTDQRGWKHRSLVRDGDPDELAPQGLLHDPPNLELLDWEAVKQDLHNALAAQGLYTWSDVQRRGAEDGLRGAILSAVRKRLINLYREANKHG